MNPYIIVIIMIGFDIISIPFMIRSFLKKDIKHKGLIVTAVLAAFIAIEAVFSVFYINANSFYDREGNTYTSQEDVIYYDHDGVEFILHQTKADRWHFISTDSRYMRISERVYVDMDGYIVFDSENQFEKTDREYVYTDPQGNEYYLAEDIKWNHKGEMKLKNKD